MTVYNLEQIAKEYFLIISVLQTKVKHIASKFFIYEQAVEQMTRICYLGRNINSQKDRDVFDKFTDFSI